MPSNRYSIFFVLVFALMQTTADAQISGGGGRIGGGGTGLRTPAGLGSGIGLRNSPVANPSPSLTPHQVLNPRGSLSTGQVLNPSPSLFRPRSGHGGTSEWNSERSQSLRLSPSELPMRARGGEWTALVHLNAKLQRSIERFHHADTWKTYLDIGVSDRDARTGHQPSNEDLREIQARFDRVARIEKYKPLYRMPIFKQTRTQLSRYISQLDDDS